MAETDTIKVANKVKAKGTYTLTNSISQPNKTGTHPVTTKPSGTTAEKTTGKQPPVNDSALSQLQNGNPPSLMPPEPSPEQKIFAAKQKTFATAIYDRVNIGILSISELGGRYRPQYEKDAIMDIIQMGISYNPLTKIMTYNPPEEEPSVFGELKKEIMGDIIHHGSAPSLSALGRVLGTLSKDFLRTAESSTSRNLLNPRPDKILRNPEVIKKMLRNARVTEKASELLETGGELLETFGRRLTALQVFYAVLSADSPESRDIEKVEDSAIVALRHLGVQTYDTNAFQVFIK